MYTKSGTGMSVIKKWVKKQNKEKTPQFNKILDLPVCESIFKARMESHATSAILRIPSLMRICPFHTNLKFLSRPDKHLAQYPVTEIYLH